MITDYLLFMQQGSWDFEIGIVDDNAWDTLKQVSQQASAAKSAFDFSKYLLGGGNSTSTVDGDDGAVGDGSTTGNQTRTETSGSSKNGNGSESHRYCKKRRTLK